MWEDSLITITHARNAVDGLGLVHHVGEPRVQGFTSALSVLIPLPGEAVGEGGGLLLLRLASLAAAVASVVYAYRLAALLGLHRAATGFVVFFLALDNQQIFYGMAGMETQVAVAVLLAGIYHVAAGDRWRAAVFLGLAPLARPDFVIWVAAALAWMAWRSRRELKTALAGTLVLSAPWYVFTTLYYGTPVPQTIRAKAAAVAQLPSFHDSLGTWLDYMRVQPGRVPLWNSLAPFLEDWATVRAPYGPLPHVIAWTLVALALLGFWRLLRVERFRPALAFVVLFLLYLLFSGYDYYYRWYLPPLTAVVILLAGAGLTPLLERAPRAAVPAVVALVGAFALALPFDWRLDRTVQQSIEQRVRLPMAVYLHEHVRPGQTVFSESSGYVGYYGRVLLLDFPGLTSKRSFDVLRRLPPARRTAPELIAALEPDWIVGRPGELTEVDALDPTLTPRYLIAAHYEVTASKARLELGDLAWATNDREFYVLRRKGVRPLR